MNVATKQRKREVILKKRWFMMQSAIGLGGAGNIVPNRGEFRVQRVKVVS